MRFFLISDNIDTLLGLRLAGVKGVVLHDREMVLKKMEEIEKDETVGIILITQKIEDMIPDKVKEMKLKKGLPLLFVIPDRHGWKGPKDFITRYVQSAIGVRIDEEGR